MSSQQGSKLNHHWLLKVLSVEERSMQGHLSSSVVARLLALLLLRQQGWTVQRRLTVQTAAAAAAAGEKGAMLP